MFVIVHIDARPLGSAARVQELWAFTIVWTAGKIVSVAAARDIEPARADAVWLAASSFADPTAA